MNNLLKMEKYQLSHNIFYWCGLIGIFLIGFFTADTYVPEAMGPMGGAATSLADIFNGMVYDSTFLLIIISSILALILGQEFSSRTIDLEVNAGHSRKTIFFAKVISYLIAFNIMRNEEYNEALKIQIAIRKVALFKSREYKIALLT